MGLDSRAGYDYCPPHPFIRARAPLRGAPYKGVFGPHMYGKRRCWALVAQLDRAPDYESGGREFESSRARHLPTLPLFVLSDGGVCVFVRGRIGAVLLQTRPCKARRTTARGPGAQCAAVAELVDAQR